MNFLLPVFKKDLMHLRFVLICWAGLFCLQSFLGIGGMKIAADNLKLQMILPQLTMFIRFMQGMMVIILIPLLVQSDPLVGTTAFWFTRPIGRKELLVTKVCFAAGIFVLLALLAELFVFTVSGFALKYILLSIPEILIEKTANLIPLFLLAVITPKFSRYAIVGVIILAIFITASLLWAFLSAFISALSRVNEFLSDPDILKNRHTLQLSTEVVKNIFIILFGSGIIAYQYLRRKTKITVVWIIVGVILSAAIGRFWKVDFIKAGPPISQTKTTAETVTFTLDAKRVRISDAVKYYTDRARDKTFTAPVDISSPASEEFVVLTNLKPEIQYPTGDKLDSSYILDLSEFMYDETKFTGPLQAAMTSSKILNPFVGSGDSLEHIEHRQIFRCDETSYYRHKNAGGTYKADAELDIYKYRVCSTLPLSRGSRDKFGSEQIVIFDILDQDNGIRVFVGEKKARLLFDRETGKPGPYSVLQDRWFPRSFYLIENVKRKEAFVAKDSNPAVDIDELLNSSSRLFSKVRSLEFAYVNTQNGTLPVIDKEWLKDARLVRVDAVRVGSVTKQIEIKDFVLPEKSTALKSDSDPNEEETVEQ